MTHFPAGTSPESVGLPSDLSDMTIATEYVMGTSADGNPILILGNGPIRLVKVLTDEAALRLANDLLAAVVQRFGTAAKEG